jgi:hypothetical protein
MIADVIEFANLYLAALDLCAMAVLIWYTFRPYDGERAYWMGASLLVYLSGHLWIRSWTWWEWWLGIRATKPVAPLQQLGVTVIGLVITTVGLIMVLRQLFKTVDVRYWYGSVLGSALLAAAVTWGADLWRAWFALLWSMV